jgi:glycosyltransferase involved in cell wall biosynthesis
MTRIGIDARLLVYRRGMGNYVYNLLMELANLPGNDQFVLYVDDLRAGEYAPKDPRFKVIKIGPKFYPFWEQISLPLVVAHDRLDVLHCPANTAPIFLPKRLKLVLTIHDVMYLLPNSILPQSPSLYQRAGRLYYRWMAPQAAKRAVRIMTVSESSKRDIADKLCIPSGKIQMVYEAGNAICRRFDDPFPVVEVKSRYAIEGRYVFALGALDPRKNTAGVLRAYTRFIQTFSQPIQLVLAGLSQEAKSKFNGLVSELGLDGKVIVLGFISEKELAALYNGAELFLYPSLYEGFGMPVLEAMACGAPVVTSPSGSLPEVAGDAALMVDPHNPDEIAEAMLKILSDNLLRERLIKMGIVQAGRFSWAHTAGQVLDVYRNC